MKKIILLILDGFGLSDKENGNAVKNAKKPILDELMAKYPRVGEVPFDSGRKMMSTVHEHDGAFVQFTKGAPDEILKKCSHIDVNGEVFEMNDEIRAKIMEENTRMGNKALRVFAVAYKNHDVVPTAFDSESLEYDMTFIGLTGMPCPSYPPVCTPCTDIIQFCQ